MIIRALVGLALGVALVAFGVPAVQSLVKHFGYYDNFTYEQSVQALLLVLACVIAVELTGLKSPRNKDGSQ